MSLQRFEGSTIEAVLEEARAVGGAGVRIVEANKLRKGGIAGFFTKERFEVAVEVPDDTPTTVVPAVDARHLSTEQEAFAALLDRMAHDIDPEPEPTTVSRRVDHPSGGERDAKPQGSVSLDRLGLPEHLCPSGMDTTVALLEALRGLPVAPPVPRASGDVVAVVGGRDAALRVARAVAADLGVDEADVVLAAEDDAGADLPLGCLLPTLPAVADERCSARWRHRPTIVAVAADVRPRGAAFARRALEALEPSATWGAVPAAAKPEDVAAWSDSLGGLDAIAVEGVDDTSSPASILAVGIPVARLDGRPATPALWTALLMERLAS